MPEHFHKHFFLFFFILISAIGVHSQVICPANIDFELGNFTGWACKTGSVTLTGGRNIITWTGNTQVNGRHTIIPSSNTGTDLFGNFPVRCPNGSGFSVKLGNTGTGQQAEGIFYNYTIPANVTDFSLLYQYAVVFQDPANHTPQEQPRFQARIINLTDNEVIGCVSFDFTADASLPGFRVSPQQSGGSAVLYKDWTPITLDLSRYAGKTIQLEFITSDCTRGGHFGYAYVDVNSSCTGAIIGSTICSGDSVATLTAPFGFESYKWYSDSTFSQVIGINQVLNLNPAPLTGAVFPVIVTPYAGFGCIDTVYASITTAPRPISDAGPDKIACKYQQVQLGTTPNPSYTYAWTPVNSISNASIANPTGFINSYSPVNFVVKTTEPLLGCFSYDTVTITPKALDTAIQVTGATSYCATNSINTTFKVTSLAVNTQWFSNTTAITGANNNTFIPATGGLYWAQISQNGCTDSTRIVPFTILSVPQVIFTMNMDTQCVTNNIFSFNNTSYISDNSPLSFSWNFNDGSVSQMVSPVKNFPLSGIYRIKLMATSSNSCSDSTSRTVYVMPNTFPNFVWDTVCTNRPVQFSNLTNENGNSSVKYLWDFENGITSSLKNPLPFIYNIAGIHAVSLNVTALGCETDVKTVKKNINANAGMQGIKYDDKTIAEGYTTLIWARESKGGIYKWNPSSQLSKATIKAPYFYGGNDTKYLITITDKNTCITIDTLQMLVLKKKGGYMPNAFTPNGDGLNDVVRPYVVGMKALKKFCVYDRWGNIVFSTVVDGDGWNGTYNKQKLDAGSFVWILEYIDTDNKMIVQKGSIMLIR